MSAASPSTSCSGGSSASPRRPDLKVVVSSATIEHRALLPVLRGAPSSRVGGRTFPVDALRAAPEDDEPSRDSVADLRPISSRSTRTGTCSCSSQGAGDSRGGERPNARNSGARWCSPCIAFVGLRAASRVRHHPRAPGHPRHQRRGRRRSPSASCTSWTRAWRACRATTFSFAAPGCTSSRSPRPAPTSAGRCGRVREGICVRLYDEASHLAARLHRPGDKRTGWRITCG